MAGQLYRTTLNDLPDVILSNIIATISDTRSRNSTSLVCRKWLHLERSTRTHLTLRGNARDLFMVPSCFRSVTHLDISLLSPWGHSLLSISSYSDDPVLISHILKQSFPLITSLTVYARNPSTLELLLPHWNKLKEIKLVRWHQRPQLTSGSDFVPVFENLEKLEKLDLSSFYCWTEDLVPALEAYPGIGVSLKCLDLMNPSFSEGFKAQEVEEITKACPNLRELYVACMFDPRYIGFVGDQSLLAVAGNCPNLARLCLSDTSALLNVRGDLNDEGGGNEDARIGLGTLIDVFSRLPLLEEFTLDVCNNVRESGPVFEMLHKKCPRLRKLKLGMFQGICMPVESKLDGIALCEGLQELSIRNVADLTDFGLIAIGRGCSRLVKFHVQGCKKITVKGMGTLASLLQRTLIDVKISCCKNLGAMSSLKALKPIQNRILRLHIDCVWDSVEQLEDLDGTEFNFDLNRLDEGSLSSHCAEFTNFYSDPASEDPRGKRKKCKYSYDQIGGVGNGNGNEYSHGNGYYGRTWDRLQSLSLWISVGELLTPLVEAGLENCPNLEEINIKVEGDCRDWSKPSSREFGLSTLVEYPRLTKMHLDCGDMLGFAHTAPSGHMDLSLWERFYLYGIGSLSLTELDYWPPQDRDVNQRSLSLPAAGLLQGCLMLRKLFIHGTAHEHFMNFLLRIPDLRDVQLREDYYPAPENDMSTEMRADSCSRFEDALNGRQIVD
ncbi:F-box/LRR-repeat MAX2-like [Heracleum sosnowskyi]|uniref:F-box/LRR-repeat MAX2-like n=1 Tax=Heracleum sosnowskyi TaxID=360622 RepID=A0AAD8MTI3_9APIA|nr:F-box/LRR-repeat MAX2-like [Heracleum sosnowskyi]